MESVVGEKIILGIDPGTNVMGYGIITVRGNRAGLVAMGVIDMRKERDPYLRLGKIFERVTGIIDEYLPDEMAIEAPFFGKTYSRCSSLDEPRVWPLLRPYIIRCPFTNTPR